MSKGNMLLGYARGKVGSMVFSRSAGEQITRAYNGSPRNDRTEPQMNQRTMFLSANKFFTHGQQAFFKFAFEDKKINESDFNAFMRNNVKKGIMMSKPAFEENTYPSVGNWLLTKGSLPGINISYIPGDDESSPLYRICGSSEPSNFTFGSLSKDLINNFGVAEGDIITVLGIIADGSNTGNTPSVYPSMRGRIAWNINQFVINTNSEIQIDDVFNGYLHITKSNTNLWELQLSAYDSQTICGAAICVSRKTSRGLKVSTTQIVNNKQGQDAFYAGQDDTYKKEVLQSWETTTRAILEGSYGTTAYDLVGFLGFRGLGTSPEDALKQSTSEVGQRLATRFSGRSNEPTVLTIVKNFDKIDTTLFSDNSNQKIRIVKLEDTKSLILSPASNQYFWPFDYDVFYNGSLIFTVPAYFEANLLLYSLNDRGVIWRSVREPWGVFGAVPPEWDLKLYIPQQYSDEMILSYTWSVLVNGESKELSLDITQSLEDERIKELSLCELELRVGDRIQIKCNDVTLYDQIR